MSTVPAVRGRSNGTLARLDQDTMAYAVESRSANTRRAYGSDLAHFSAWCAAEGVDGLPANPETVARYVAAMAEHYKPSTIARRLAAISVAHQLAGFPSPTSDAAVRAVHRGVRRTVGVAPDQHDPVGIKEVHRMLSTLDTTTLSGLRDRALLLVGFALAARRSELVALQAEDFREETAGLVVTVKRSKTDQEGRGAVRALPLGSDAETCPVRALRAWLEAAGIESGPVFRGVDRHGNVSGRAMTGAAVALVVKRCAERAGLDPARFSGHSLRAGFVTTAAARGASERAIAAQTGHAPGSAVLRTYIRHASAFTDNAATQLGL